MRIEWDESAVQDRERIFEFLYPFNPRAAEQADLEIENAVNRLIDNPLLGKEWIGQGRKLLISKASLLIVYAVLNKTIIIMAVAHQKEQFPSASL